MAKKNEKNDDKVLRHEDDLYYDHVPETKKRMSRTKYYEELSKLEVELVKLQEWVKARKLRVVVVFEGRDAAGKGGAIKTISGCMNPRICRIVALGIPTEKEKTQWYFQRYVSQLPSGERLRCLIGVGTTGPVLKR